MATTTPKLNLKKPVVNAETNWGFRLNETIDILDDAVTLVGGVVNLSGLPTASGGLASGDLWVDEGDNFALRVTP